MILVSGIVLDYFTDIGVPSALVQVTTTTGVSVEASGIANSAGIFYVNVPNAIGSNCIYTPVKSGHVGYSREISKNITFNSLFTRSSGTLPPSFSGSVIEDQYRSMLFTSPNVRDIIHNPCHLYAITDNGLDVIDKNTLNNVGYITNSGGFTSIALLNNVCVLSGVLVGTSLSGVYEFPIPIVYDIFNKDHTSELIPKWSTPVITSNRIDCIHENSKGEVIVGTASGIDFFNISGTQYNTIYSGVEGTTACFVSEYGDLYYSPTNSGLHVKLGPINSNWSLPDYDVVFSGTGLYNFPLLSEYINDIQVTSVSGSLSNHVFLATRSGLLMYTEDSDLNVSASGSILFTNFP